MYTLPNLIEEDINAFDATLKDFIAKTEASLVFIADKAGNTIVQQGDTDRFDATSLGALACGAFGATEMIGQNLGEPSFTCIYQQGEKWSLLINNIDEQTLLVIIFPSTISVGLLKYYSSETISAAARQLEHARVRAPGQGIDLSMLDLADTTDVFKKKES